VLGNIDIATNNELFLCKGNWSCATRIARIYFVDKRGIQFSGSLLKLIRQKASFVCKIPMAITRNYNKHACSEVEPLQLLTQNYKM
jgi:hypothetical protein